MSEILQDFRGAIVHLVVHPDRADVDQSMRSALMGEDLLFDNPLYCPLAFMLGEGGGQLLASDDWQGVYKLCLPELETYSFKELCDLTDKKYGLFDSVLMVRNGGRACLRGAIKGDFADYQQKEMPPDTLTAYLHGAKNFTL